MESCWRVERVERAVRTNEPKGGGARAGTRNSTPTLPPLSSVLCEWGVAARARRMRALAVVGGDGAERLN